MRRALSLVLLLLVASDASADTCPNGRTPNLCMKPTAQQLLNDNFSRIDETLGGMMSGPFDPANNGKVFDRGGGVIHAKNAIFGAVCDGSNDDTAAIHKAVAVGAAARIPVLLTGTCRTDTGLILPAHTTLIGNGFGSVLQAGPTLGNVPIIQSEANPATDGARDTNITIRNLTLDGSANATGTTSGPCITMRSVVDARMENIRCISPKGDCITIAKASTAGVLAERNTVAGLHCTGAARNGIAITSGRDITFTDFHITSAALHGVDIEAETADLVLDDIVVGPGTIRDVDTSVSTCGVAITADAASQTIQDITVSNVTIVDAGDGVCFRGVTNLVLANNIIRSPSDDGIFTQTKASEDELENIRIDGNIIEDPGQYGINWTHAAVVDITDNTIKNTGAHGIRVTGATGGTISGNTVDTTATSMDCIAYGTVDNTTIAGNTLLNCARKGIALGSAATDTTILGGTIIGGASCTHGIEEASGGTSDRNMIVPGTIQGCTTKVALEGGGLTRALSSVTRAAETIAAGGVITANGCHGIKRITAAGAVTTDTTNTFTAPAATNTGCVMDVCNTSANVISLDANANFVIDATDDTGSDGDLDLGQNDCVRVGSDGTIWRQLARMSVN